MRILCIISSKDTLAINTSTMVLNKTILDGLKKSNQQIDLLTIDQDYNDDAIKKSDVFKYINRLFLIKSLNKKSDNNYLAKKPINIIGKIRKFYRNSVKEVFFSNYNFEDTNKFFGNEKYDLILTFCPPLEACSITRKIISRNKNLHGVKWIQYWSDPVAASLLDFKRRVPMNRFFHKLVEAYSFRGADEIIYCTPILCRVQKSLYPRFASKMRYVDVAYSNDYLKLDVEYGNDFNKSTGQTQIGYFGSFYSSVRNITPLLDTMKRINDCDLIIYGDSDLEKVTIPNVKISPGRLSYNEVIKYEKKVDILICLCNKKGFQVPGKIFYYASINKPIIVVLDGIFQDEIRDYLIDLNRYILCDNNIDSIQEAIIIAKSNLNVNVDKISDRLNPKIVAKSIVK